MLLRQRGVGPWRAAALLLPSLQADWRGTAGDKAMKDYGPVARLRIRMQVSCYREQGMGGRSYRVGDR